MANLIYQGKLIRQSTRHFSKTSGSQYVNWGGQFLSLSNNITFFHNVKRIE